MSRRARGDDLVVWGPIAERQPITLRDGTVPMVHWCPTAVTFSTTTRDALDPMALGECRYCKGSMPHPMDLRG